MIFNPTRYRDVAKFTKEIFTIPTQVGTVTYSGSDKWPSWNNYNPGYMTVSGQTIATNAGTYTVTFSLKDKENCVWADYTTDDKQVTWTLQRATITDVPTGLGATYYGQPIEALISYEDPSMFSITGDTVATNAGEYTVIATPTSNYQWGDGTTTGKEIVWYIYKADPNLNIYPYEVTLTQNSPSATVTATYDGNGILSVENVPGWPILGNVSVYASGKKVYCSSNSFTESANTAYSIIVNETQNYESARYDFGITVSGVGTGGEKEPNIITLNPEEITLNGYGDTKTIEVSRLGNGAITAYAYDTSIADVTVSGTTVTVTCMTHVDYVTTDIYINVDETDEYTGAAAMVTATVSASGSGTVTLNPQSVTLNRYGDAKTIEVIRPGNGTITATSADESIAIVNVYGTTVVVTCMTQAESAETSIYINVAGTDEYASTTVTATVTVLNSLSPISLNPTSISLSMTSGDATVYVKSSGGADVNTYIPNEYISYISIQSLGTQDNRTILIRQIKNVNVDTTFEITFSSANNRPSILTVTLHAT